MKRPETFTIQVGTVFEVTKKKAGRRGTQDVVVLFGEHPDFFYSTRLYKDKEGRPFCGLDGAVNTSDGSVIVRICDTLDIEEIVAAGIHAVELYPHRTVIEPLVIHMREHALLGSRQVHSSIDPTTLHGR